MPAVLSINTYFPVSGHRLFKIRLADLYAYGKNRKRMSCFFNKYVPTGCG